MKYTITIITVSLVASALIGAFLVYPEYQKYREVRFDLQSVKKSLQNQQEYQKKLEDTYAKIQEKQDLIDKVESALPDSPDIPSFLNFLQAISETSGISLENIGWQSLALSQQKDQRIKEYLVNVELVGSYFAFKQFLLSLEQSARLIDVVKINFDSPKVPNEPMNFKLTLKIRSY